MIAILNKWNNHNLTLIGKITVIKTFAIPKIICPLTVLKNPPEEVISLIIKSLFHFLWDGKPEKMQETLLNLIIKMEV